MTEPQQPEGTGVVSPSMGRTYPVTPTARRWWTEKWLRRLGVLVLSSLLIGVACGWLWHAAVDLPYYTINDVDSRATISQQGIQQIFSSDAWYAGIGTVVSLGLGWWSWRWFGNLGWPVTVIAATVALLTALTTWRVGVALGPQDFADEIARATPDMQVPINFELHAPISILLWILMALIPVLLGSSFGKDDEIGPEPDQSNSDHTRP